MLRKDFETIVASCAKKSNTFKTFKKCFPTFFCYPNLIDRYDWTDVGEAEKGERVTVSDSVAVQAGQYVYVEQAVGRCDGSTVETLMFRIGPVEEGGVRGEPTAVFRAAPPERGGE